MGATNPKFAKSVRKLKKTKKHSNIPKGQLKEKFPKNLITEKNWEHTALKIRNSRKNPKHKVWGSFFFKEEIAVEEKRKRVWVIST